MKKIGILGGTFNPIHNGHIKLAKAAMQQYSLDEIWLMPSKCPPYKSHVALLPEEDRLSMAELAAMEEKNFFASDYELKREGDTYTVDTLIGLTTLYPETRFFFLIGGDSLLYFSKWRNPEKIVSLATILYSGRSGIGHNSIENEALLLQKLFPNASFFPIDMEPYGVSSHQIRRSFFSHQEEQIKDKLPEPVYRYLKEHKLFSNITYRELDKEMRRVLTRESRYYHSVGVAHFCASLAAAYGLDVKKALTAGLLHDAAKPFSDDELVRECELRGIKVNDIERRNGFLLHGKLASYLIQERYYINDPDVISSIFHHCEGNSPMSDYEKILFLSDYLEPFRSHPTTPSLDELRNMAFHDLDDTLYFVLLNTVRYLKESGGEIEPTTVTALSYYTKIYQNKHPEGKT